MRPDSIYLSSPVWLQQLMVSAYGYVLRARRHGGLYGDNLRQLRASQHLSADALRNLQQTRLTAIVNHAFEYVPYYKELSRERKLIASEITLDNMTEALPILHKRQIRSEPQRFISTATSSDRLLTINTSGTTGSPMAVACTLDALRENYAFFSRFLEWHGIDSRSRSATFAGRPIVPQTQDKPPFWRHNPAFNNLQFSSYHLSPRNLPSYVEKLTDWSPELIDTYPSSGSTIAKHINIYGQQRKIRPNVVVTSSETLLDHQRAAIEEAFGCPVRDQYGSAEMVAFLAECELGTLHAAPEYGVLEIIPDQETESGLEGRLIATGFINSAMPLLRYDTGDRAVRSEDKCNCGRAFPAINKILGRADDFIITPEGARIGRLDPIFKGAKGILECQIVQETLDTITIKAVLGEGSSEDALMPVVNQLQQRLPASMKIKAEFLPSLPRSRNGKLRAVVSLLSNR